MYITIALNCLMGKNIWREEETSLLKQLQKYVAPTPVGEIEVNRPYSNLISIRLWPMRGYNEFGVHVADSNQLIQDSCTSYALSKQYIVFQDLIFSERCWWSFKLSVMWCHLDLKKKKTCTEFSDKITACIFRVKCNIPRLLTP